MSDTTNTDFPIVVLVHGAFADASSWNGGLHEAATVQMWPLFCIRS